MESGSRGKFPGILTFFSRGCNGRRLSYVILQNLFMKMLRFWKSGMVILLVLIGLVAYKSIAVETGLKGTENQCCSKEIGCPLEKSPTPASSGSSIIWDSFSDNLLSTHI